MKKNSAHMKITRIDESNVQCIFYTFITLFSADLMDTDVIEKKICVTNIVDPVNFWAHIGTGEYVVF